MEYRPAGSVRDLPAQPGFEMECETLIVWYVTFEIDDYDADRKVVAIRTSKELAFDSVKSKTGDKYRDPIAADDGTFWLYVQGVGQWIVGSMEVLI